MADGRAVAAATATIVASLLTDINVDVRSHEPRHADCRHRATPGDRAGCPARTRNRPMLCRFGCQLMSRTLGAAVASSTRSTEPCRRSLVKPFVRASMWDERDVRTCTA